MTRVKIGNGPMVKCPIGGTVVSGNIESVHVDEFHRVVIHRGASLGVRDRTSIFHAGTYGNAWLYGKWLQQRGPKYVVVEPTAMPAHQLLLCTWAERSRDGKWRSGYQRFEPGEYGSVDRDFRNDVFETVIVPEFAVAKLWDDYGQGGRHVEFTRPGKYQLKVNDLSHRVSSVAFKHDDWEEVSQRLGGVASRREVGEPITVPFDLTGAPGIVLHPEVALGRLTEHEKSWHFDQRVGISATVGTGESSPVKVEVTATSETEAGAAGADRRAYTEESSVSVDVAADDGGIVKGFVRAQLMRAEVQIFRTLKNKRTGATIEQEGEDTGPLYAYSVHIERGVAP